METEPAEPQLSDRERKLIRIRMQLRQNAMFVANAGNNEGMLKLLAVQRAKLERELAELEQQEENPE